MMKQSKTVLRKTNSRLNNNPDQNAQDILLKELLRRWKPEKKHIIN